MYHRDLMIGNLNRQITDNRFLPITNLQMFGIKAPHPDAPNIFNLSLIMIINSSPIIL